MAGLARWAGFALGLVIVVVTFSSVVGTIVLPKGVRSRISYTVWRAIERPFMAAAARMRRYESKDRLLGLLGPVSLLALLGAWLLLFLLGYALMLLPLTGDGFMAALRLSGSSLFTLGLASSPRQGATVVSFAAAATGLVVIALQVGYLPTIYGAYNRRETVVNMLESRAGEPAWGVELLAREHLIGGLDSLGPFFTDWERWAADLTESHVNYPWLLSFRSPYPLRSWVVSHLAVLDAAALYLALVPSQAPPAARHCLRTGFLGLRALAGVYRVELPGRPSAGRADRAHLPGVLRRAGPPGGGRVPDGAVPGGGLAPRSRLAGQLRGGRLPARRPAGGGARALVGGAAQPAPAR
jgi:hypothetical protein